MTLDCSRYRVLKEFFQRPLKDFHMRELARQTHLAQPSVSNHLAVLVGEGFIRKEKKWLYPTYRADLENARFRAYKKADTLIMLEDSGIIDHLYSSCMPDAIVLFGSASLGEDTEESDIDIFLICKKKRLDLKRYEIQMNRKISVFFCDDFMKLSKELRNNVLNGIVLKGYITAY